MPAEDHPFAQLLQLTQSGLGAMGIDLVQITRRLAGVTRDRDFVNVTEKVLRVPIGTWPRNGTLRTVDGLQAIALGPLTRGCGWTAGQVEVFLVSVRRALMDNSCRLYIPFHIICAQKPHQSS